MIRERDELRAIILAHQQGLCIGDIVEVQPSALNVKGIFVGKDHKYLTSGYLVLPGDPEPAFGQDAARGDDHAHE